MGRHIKCSGSDLHGAALVGASVAIVPRRRTRPLKPSRYSHRVEMPLHGTIRSHLTVAIAAVAVLAGAPAAAQDSDGARRSEERRVGKEWGSTWRLRLSTVNLKQKPS